MCWIYVFLVQLFLLSYEYKEEKDMQDTIAFELLCKNCVASYMYSYLLGVKKIERQN